jgi:hypothetical protein
MPKTRKGHAKIESNDEKIQIKKEENVSTTIKHEASVKAEENEENLKALLKKDDSNDDIK